MPEDWKYQISLALPESIKDSVISAIYDIVEAALDAAIAEERERVWSKAIEIAKEHLRWGDTYIAPGAIEALVAARKSEGEANESYRANGERF